MERELASSQKEKDPPSIKDRRGLLVLHRTQASFLHQSGPLIPGCLQPSKKEQLSSSRRISHHRSRLPWVSPWEKRERKVAGPRGARAKHSLLEVGGMLMGSTRLKPYHPPSTGSGFVLVFLFHLNENFAVPLLSQHR